MTIILKIFKVYNMLFLNVSDGLCCSIPAQVNRLFHNQNILFCNQNVLFLNQGLFHNQNVLFFNHEVLFFNQRLFHN